MIIKKTRETLKTKFAMDVLWTFSGRFSAAVSGMALNILVGNFFKAEGLGVFNQAIAIYMIANLFTVFGINNSVVKHSAEYKDDREKLNDVLSSSLILVLLISSGLTALFYVVLFGFSGFLNNPPLEKSLLIILAALPFYSLNKVLVAFLNGLRRMKPLSVISALRWIVIILFAAFAILAGRDLYFIFYAFFIAEGVLLVLLLFLNRRNLSPSVSALKEWWKKHLAFGTKSFLAVAISDLNRRVDILMVGYFLNNEAAGLYSFAATAARGFFMIGHVIRRNFNPIASNLWANGKIEQLKEYFEKVKKNLAIYLIPLLILSALAYPWVTKLLMKDPVYQGTWVIFLVLLVGVGLMVQFNWTGGILVMADFLNETLKIGVVTVLINFFANIAMIPLLGIIGAAIATSLAYIIRLFLVRHYIKKCMGLRLF